MTDKKVMPLRPMNILLIEDNDSDRFLVENALGNRTGEFNLTAVRSIEEALPALAQPFDVMLLDWSLPGSSGLEALKTLTQTAPKTAIIILTGNNDEGSALISLKQGAQDYLIKEQADANLIKRSIRYALGRKQFESNLITMANYDMLTGLVNRNLFESRLDMALARGRRSGEPVGVLFLDLNGFKQINDTLGHESGDALLKGVGERLKKTLRECDTVARFGGDEFAVLLEGAANPRNYAIVAQKMINALTPPFNLNGHEAGIGVSIGITIGRPDTPADELIKQADDAMYRAKASGDKSNYKFHTENLSTEAIERMQMEQELGSAIRHKTGLCLFYQPKLDMASGALAGAEALLRWDHQKHGILAPADFIHLLTPVMAAELDQWVLETVCRDIQCWQIAGMKPTQISVHTTSQHLASAASAETLLAVLRYTGLQVNCMAIEVKETALLHYGSEAFDILSRICETSVEVHLDTFDGEISSIRLLTRLPLDAVKINRQMIARLSETEQRAAATKALIALGEQLGAKTADNSKKTGEPYLALHHNAPENIQSTINSKPLPAQEFFHWLGNRSQAS